MSGWVWLVSSVNGLPHRVPDDEAAVGALVGRGFERTDIPGDWYADSEEFEAALEEWNNSREIDDQPVEVPAEEVAVPDQAESATSEKEDTVNG